MPVQPAGQSSQSSQPNPEVLERPVRRRFSEDYKRRIVQEAAACTEPGQIGVAREPTLDELERRVSAMGAYRSEFRSRHTVLPVIHVEQMDQALRNADIARGLGADGVFLINHSISSAALLRVCQGVRDRFGDWWVGVNCLDLTPEEAFRRIGPDVSGLWVDNAMVDERSEGQPAAEHIRSAREASGWQGLYFGGVAFKYQRNVRDDMLPQAARSASAFMDVLTTSGPGTGAAAAQAKIRTLRESLGDFPLAIASGITPANVGDYLSYADCFLVATGISRSFTSIDSDLLHQLMDAVRSYEAAETRRWDAGMPRSVCFVCEWNEGRSAHLELSVRHKLRQHGSTITVCSAGFSQGGGVNSQRRAFLLRLGIPDAEIAAHRSRVFDQMLTGTSDLVLVAELPMKHRLLSKWPELHGKVMTVRGFVAGASPGTESLSVEDAHIQDAGGSSPVGKQRLYEELEGLAAAVADRLLEPGGERGHPALPRTDLRVRDADDVTTEPRRRVRGHEARPGTPELAHVAVVSNNGDHHDYSYEVEQYLERAGCVLYLGPIGQDRSRSLVGLIESRRVPWVYGRHDDRCGIESVEELVISGWRFRFFPKKIPPIESDDWRFTGRWTDENGPTGAASVLASTDAPVTVLGSGFEFEHWSCPIGGEVTIENTTCDHRGIEETVVSLAQSRRHLVVTPSARLHRVTLFDLLSLPATVQSAY